LSFKVFISVIVRIPVVRQQAFNLMLRNQVGKSKKTLQPQRLERMFAAKFEV
jgi:hypothetical protein